MKGYRYSLQARSRLTSNVAVLSSQKTRTKYRRFQIAFRENLYPPAGLVFLKLNWHLDLDEAEDRPKAKSYSSKYPLRTPALDLSEGQILVSAAFERSESVFWKKTVSAFGRGHYSSKLQFWKISGHFHTAVIE